MGKIADKYFEVHPWMIVENGFDPEYAMIAESVFSQANEYMGTRGYLEEGYSGTHLQGCYFNRIYDRMVSDGPHYKGIVNTTEFMVNGADWLYTRIFADGVQLDLAKARIRDFTRSLDMRNGLLTRSFVWTVAEDKEIRLTFQRILSMEQVENASQKIVIQALGFSGEIQAELGIDFSVIHQSAGRNMWKDVQITAGEGWIQASGETLHTGQKLCVSMAVTTNGLYNEIYKEEEKKAVWVFQGKMVPGNEIQLERKVRNTVCKSSGQSVKFIEECGHAMEALQDTSFEKIRKGNQVWWKKVWDVSDIVIDGDPENQQGIRFCIFQLFQTYHGAVEGSNIGAKGLTGEAYNGNAFWDTETYCLPFFLFQDPEGAGNLLKFRYATLEEARKRASQLDCKGAFYPIATISGRECCNLWQHASLQLQASTAVAYGIWFYEKVTKDKAFLKEYGLEMLIEISRMLATRGDYFHNGTRYGYFCVMGPDEFQMMVNNNFYTNAMGKFTFEYTVRMLEEFLQEDKAGAKQIMERCGLSQAELADWKDKAEKMYIPYEKESGIYEQHQGYFELPHIDVDAIPVAEFPLYNNWSYDRIYRNDMIKQPDVLMFMLMFNRSFDQEILRKNYEFYEPRCIHESSLSPSVHSILAGQLGKKKEAYDFFRFATRMDLDNYNRNSGEGIHTTSIAAAWMNIVYGFGGFRSDGEKYVLNPSLPDEWNSYSFSLKLDQAVVAVHVEKDRLELLTKISEECKSGPEILIYGRNIKLEQGSCEVKVPGN